MPPGAKPQLVIPMTFDGKEALDMLKKLGLAGKEAGEGLQEAQGKAKGLGEAVKDVLTHQGYQLLKDGAAALSAGYKETADYIKEVSSEYVKLREVLQQVAALKGVDNTGSFTSDQARAAAGASLKPEEWVKFQESFQSYAGAYLEGDQQRLTEPDAEEYQKRLAQFAKARGISADQAAQLGGGVLQFAEGPLGVDEAMSRFGRAYQTLERSVTPVNQLLPQMSKVMAQGANADEAAQLLNIAAEFAPGEEETYVRSTLRGINSALLEGRGDELGVKEGMSPLELVQAASAKIKERVDGGENLKALMAEYFSDERESKGMKGFMNRGLIAGGFDRVAGYIEGTPDDYTSEAISKYEASDQGRRAKAEAELASARIGVGEKYKEVEQMKLEAELELTKEGRFEQYGIGDAAREMWIKANPLSGVGSLKESLINERTVQNAWKRAKANGVSYDDRWFSGDENAPVQMTNLEVNDEVLDAINRTNAAIAEGNAQRDRQGRRALSAPPADPKTRPR